AADKNIEASLGIDIAIATSTKRLLIFWMLDFGASLGFGSWSLGFRARLVDIGCAARTSDGERVEESLGVVPIARAVFHPGDCVRISLEQALDQTRGDADNGDRRDVVEINFQPRIADALHDFAEVAVETF